MKNEIEAKKDSGPSDQLQMSSPLASRALFWPARYRCGSKFLHHIPLAFWLTDVVKPHTVVEVGLDTGQSYFGFCQAIERLNMAGRCYGFSETAPDDGILTYNTENYEEFSTIVERAAVEALRRFKDESIDLLVVNAALPDETLRSLKDIWGRKLSKRAVLLVHNYLNTPHEAAVQDMIDEMDAERGVITFEKGHGVAVILYGSQQDERLEHLARIQFGSPEYNIVHSVFSRLGSAHYHEWSSGKFEKDAQVANRKAKQALEDLNTKQQALETAQNELTSLEAAYGARSDKIAEMQVSLFDMQQKHLKEDADLRKRVHALKDALEQETAARETEQKRAGDAARARDKALEDAKTRQREIMTLTESLEEAMTLRDKSLQEAEDTKQANAKEITILIQSLEEHKGIALQAKAEQERQRQTLRSRIQSLELDLGKAIERNEFDKRYLQIQVRLRERLIERMSSQSRVAFSQRFTGKDLRKDHARIVATSPKFDADWYLATYPDVKESGMDPALHFVSNGFYEGRSPSPHFDCIAYIIQHPEVLESDINPLVHAAKNDLT